ncbi:IS1249 family transposase [Leucobacter exalbidus]|uniref:IS1249 family transposase n=1 Tax=Leucobacter exalbidus TaxID=662960 RepID=UPI001AEAEEDF
MPKSENTTTCLICNTKLVRNGTTPAGTVRWRCPKCGASSVRKRPDVTRKAQLDQFLTWITGKASQADLGGASAARQFRRTTAWCWALRPVIPVTGAVYDVLQIDGFNLRTGWCVLVATHRGTVVAFQWCSRESAAAWGALMQRLPAPLVVVCDGGSGMHAALNTHWPTAQVQRCLVHLQRNVRKHVTTRSKTPAGQGLWGLALKLTRVKTVTGGEEWAQLFLAWENSFLHLTKERTYRKHAAEVPSWARPNQTWWYTHQRLRSGYQVLQRAIQGGHLFTFLSPQLAHLNVPSTTNEIEGGTNSQMRLLLRLHRGMPEEHQRRAIEWWLYLHSEFPNPAVILKEHQPEKRQHTNTAQPESKDPAAPVSLYDTGLDANEGLWTRSGWAGRP